jgi:mono/diheme cytochrome c family protein
MSRSTLILSYCLVTIWGCGEDPSKIGVQKEVAPAVAAGPVVKEDRSGAEVYAKVCKSCHGAEANGDRGNDYPPLAGSEWVTGNAEVPIRIVLNGLSGEISVKGESYTNTMEPQFVVMRSEAELAAVLTYVRSNFGNDASAVTVEEVAAVKAQVEGHAKWTSAELVGLLAVSEEIPADGGKETPEAPEAEGVDSNPEADGGSE